MGSYPRISDRRMTLDLFGPVNRLYCTSYDKAATYFLACLKAGSLLMGVRLSIAAVMAMPSALLWD